MTRRYFTKAVLDELRSRLTPSDLAVIRQVAKSRFVSGDQLARLHFADSGDPLVDGRAARRALLRLTRLGCLRRLPRMIGGVRRGSAGYVYALDRAGERLAAECGWQPEGRRRRSDVPGTLFLAHALRVAELHTLLVEADRSRTVELLELAAEPACWRRYGGVGGQRCFLKPDSYVRLGIGAYEDSYFVEVDMGSEGSRALGRKLKQYAEYAATGIEQTGHGVFPKVLWLGPDRQRSEVINNCVARLSGSVHELFAVTEFTEAIHTFTNPPT